MKLSDLRTDYGKHSLDEQSLPENPSTLFAQWMQAAIDANLPDANAMVLSTIAPDGYPASRIVLLRDFTRDAYTFYTNYESTKGRHLANSQLACLLFFWPTLERQIRITGRCEKVSPQTSDAYFASRPYESQIGAWASPQSEPLPDRDALEARLRELKERYPDTVPRPPHWGGYELNGERYEFWQGRPSRLHDRIFFERSEGGWHRQRLAP